MIRSAGGLSTSGHIHSHKEGWLKKTLDRPGPENGNLLLFFPRNMEIDFHLCLAKSNLPGPGLGRGKGVNPKGQHAGKERSMTSQGEQAKGDTSPVANNGGDKVSGAGAPKKEEELVQSRYFVTGR